MRRPSLLLGTAFWSIWLAGCASVPTNPVCPRPPPLPAALATLPPPTSAQETWQAFLRKALTSGGRLP